MVGDVAGLVAAGAFLMLVLVLAVPILRLGRTIDAATQAITDLNARTGPLLDNVTATVDGVHTALRQVQVSLDGVNAQLARVDTITAHAQTVSANVANVATVVAAAAANPLVKVASFGYGLRKAAAARRHADTEREVRAEVVGRRRAGRRA